MEVMDEVQRPLPGFPGASPQAPFLQVAPDVHLTHNLLPMQNLQPAGQLEYKVPGRGQGFWSLTAKGPCMPVGQSAIVYVLLPPPRQPVLPTPPLTGTVPAAAAPPSAAKWNGSPWPEGIRWRSQHPVTRPAAAEAPAGPLPACHHDTSE